MPTDMIQVDVFPDAPVVTRTFAKGSPLRLFAYGGRTFATGLFALHDQEGFSLTDSLVECAGRGWVPCLLQFVIDAAVGWSGDRHSYAEARKRAVGVVEAAIADVKGMGLRIAGEDELHLA